MEQVKFEDVFRLETLDGEGPYRNEPLYSILMDHYTWDNPSQPVTSKEKCGCPLRTFVDLEGVIGDKLFGFASVLEYLNWFYDRGTRETIKTFGLVLRHYRASEIIHGEKQLVFKKENATLIETLSPLEGEPL